MKNSLFRRAIVFVMIIVFVISVAACGAPDNETSATTSTTTTNESSANTTTTTSETAPEKKLVFAQIYSVVHPFFIPCDEGAKAKAKELGIEVKIDAPAQADIGLQVNMIENYISQKVDGIAICAVAGDGLKPVIAKAKAAGIPVIMFGVDALGSDRIAYVGTNQEQFAQHGAELLAKAMNYEGDIIVNMGVATAPDQITRVETFRKVLTEKYPKMKIVDVQADNADPAKALANVENMWQAHPDIKGFYGTDAISGAAIISAQKSKNKKIAIVVGDDTAEIIQGIRDGYLSVTMVQKPYDWAYEAIQALYDYKNGKTIDEYIWTDLTDVTKENVDQLYPPSN